MKKCRHRRNRGIGHLELLCALFVVTVGAFGAIQMHMLSMDSTKAVNEYAIALRALNNEMETLRALPFSALEDGSHPFKSETPELERLVRPAGTCVIKEYAGVPDLKEVQVSLRWTGAHGRRIEKHLTTLIAKKR
ncbi:MAG TPA: hypothetical protein PLI09_11850 [Candidatus Hydrogenedentes bacterium]|mgnify:CR=1 FL=1|nr:hypothetical protein [Candidatus Hydrogenedentota bacterium]